MKINYMQRCKINIFISLLIVLAPQYLYALNCPDNVVSYWRLDETSPSTYMDSIKSNDGSCSGSCPDVWITGAVNGSQQFDGASDGIAVPAAADFNWTSDASFSIEMWVKRSSGTINASGEVMVGRNDQATPMEWWIEIRDVAGSGQVAFKLTDVNGTGAGTEVVGSKPITLDKWHHVVAIRDASSRTNMIYVDGEFDAQQQNIQYNGGFASNSANLNFGWIDDTDNRRLQGWLDEIAVYNRVLTENEIKLHYYLSRGYCEAWDNAVRITPMGDSITKDRLGVSDPRPVAERVGYRRQLYDNLLSNDYWFDFIGTESDGDPGEFDTHHTAWGGLVTSHLVDMLPDGIFQSPDDSSTINLNTSGPYLDAYPADIILLHIGTNEVDSVPLNTSLSNLTTILDHVDTADERTTVLLARIINRAPGGAHASTSNFNDAVDNLADSRILDGDKIIVVDMENNAGLDYEIDDTAPYNNDFLDDVHPNPRGYPKMGDYWYQILDTFLPQFNAPAITSAAVLRANEGVSYRYQVVATGTGTLTYQLVNSPPSGMTIDSQGLIQWTPPATGRFPVTVRVNNPMPFGQVGSVDQAFTIEVNAAGTSITGGGGGGGGGGGCFIGTAADSDALNTGSEPAVPAILVILFVLASRRVQKFGPQDPKNPLSQHSDG